MKGPILAIAGYGLLYTSRSFQTCLLGAFGVSGLGERHLRRLSR